MPARLGQPNETNDPAYQAEWRERVRIRKASNKIRFAIRVTHEFIFLTSRAANRRGMTNSAYARRAIAAFVASDLDMAFEDVCALFPAPKESDRSQNGVRWPRDNGEGYGQWEVKS